MKPTDKINPEAATNQNFDTFLKNEFEHMANHNHSLFFEQMDAAAFTASIMERINKESETAAKCAEPENQLQKEEDNHIVAALYCSNQKERTPMKSKKILVAAIAAALCLTSATCFAFGKIGGFVSHSHWVEDDFPSITKMEQVLNTSPDVVENFSNGFNFTRYSIGEATARDENGAELETLPRLSLDYRNADNQWIALSINGVFTGQDFGEVSGSILLDDGEKVNYHYAKDHYKFVPVNYEITPEDQKAMDVGELFIGYGADAVEDCYMTNMIWVKDGMKYTLCGQDLSLDQDDMVEMAKEVITGGK